MAGINSQALATYTNFVPHLTEGTGVYTVEDDVACIISQGLPRRARAPLRR